VCGSVLQYVALCCGACAAVCCSVLQCAEKKDLGAHFGQQKQKSSESPNRVAKLDLKHKDLITTLNRRLSPRSVVTVDFLNQLWLSLKKKKRPNKPEDLLNSKKKKKKKNFGRP